MEHRRVRTEDGSMTLYVPGLGEHYHSVHGALRESMHIFIRAGLEYLHQPETTILEAGFGTGLNACLVRRYAREHGCKVYYHTLEKYPLSAEEIAGLDYDRQFCPEDGDIFSELHRTPWDTVCSIEPGFTLYKQRADFRDFHPTRFYDLVFFDAFSPDVQPHLWTEESLRPFCEALRPGGILVTYCVKGIVKQALRRLGFALERLPGPPGKREMLRATRI